MKALKYIVAAAAVLLTVSCSQKALDDVNEDLNHPKDVTANFIFADIPTATAISVTGGDFNTYLGVAVEHWGGAHAQMFSADQRRAEWNSSSTFNNPWVNTYVTLKNCLAVIEKCADDATGTDAGDAGLRGMAEVLFAYNLAVLTDLFGDVPYKEAFDYKKFMTPAVDSQESIYADIFKILDQAIADLQSKTSVSNYDLLYGGDTALWTKFAKGLKARLLLHTVLRASDKAAVYAQISALCDESFSDPSEQASFNAYNSTNYNPLFDFEWSRDDIAISESLYNKLADRNDPRAEVIYFDSYYWCHLIPGDEDLDIYPIPNGIGEEAQYEYSYDCFVFAQIASTHLLSYHEVQFIKAEAEARLGHEVAAKAAAKNAIEAAFINTQASLVAAMNAPDLLNYGGLYYEDGDPYEGVALTSDMADDYYDAVVDGLSGDELLAEIMVQKYLAFYGANGESVEAYNDIRRLMAANEDFIELENPNNAAGKFPLRCGYGSSDTTANPNVKERFGTGAYVYTEPVWWALGTR